MLPELYPPVAGETELSEHRFNIRAQAIGGGASQVLLHLLEQLYAGEDLTSYRTLLRATARDYVEALQEGHSGLLTDVDWNSPDFDTLQHLTENVYQFAAAKNYHELKDLSEAVRDGDRVRSFSEFQEEARKIVGKYNGAWLRTEYNQAVAAAQSGARWNEFARNKQTMPYLQYQCVMDENTRADHAALHGIIKRIDDPFWDRYMPPNGWGCRCEAVQLPGSSYTETADKDIHAPAVPDMFQINFGKQGIAFPEGHAYFRRLPKDFARQAKDMAREEVRRVIANAEQYNRLKDNPDYMEVRFDNYTGGVSAIHREHNFHKVGGVFEREVMQAGYNEGMSVILGKERSSVIGERFTEGLWNGKQFEVAGKQAARDKDYLNGLKHCASKRTTQIAIIDLPNGGFNSETLEKGLNRYKGLEKLGGGQFLKFERVIVVENGMIVYDAPF